MPTVVTSSIGSGARDYADISAWEAATDNDLVAADEQHDGVLYDDSDFTAGAEIRSAVTDATRFRRLKVNSGDEYDIAADTGVEIAGSGHVIVMRETFLEVIGGMHIDCTSTSGAVACIRLFGTALLLSRVYLTYSGANADAGARGMASGSANSEGSMESIIIDGGDGNMQDGAEMTAGAGGISWLNCVVFDVTRTGGFGFSMGNDAQHTMRNCISMNSQSADFSSITNVDGDNLLASDTTAFGTTSFDSETDTDIFTDPANSDFTLLSTGNAHENGATQSPVFDDFNGTQHGSTSGTWNIGAYDGPTSAATVTEDFRHRTRPLRRTTDAGEGHGFGFARPKK